MVNVAALVIGIVVLGIAAIIGRLGRRQQRRRRLVTETPTTEIRSLDSEGLVELKGEVAATETFRSPVGNDESVLSAWEIDEWDESGTTDLWETRATGIYATPFSIADGTGEVRVDVGNHVTGEDEGHFDIELGPIDLDRTLSSGVSAENVLCSLEDFSVEATVPPDAEPPDRIAEFVRGESGISSQTDSITNVVDIGTKHGERRYYEGTIEPGQEIYLLGEARAASDATYPLGPDDVVIAPPETGDGSVIVSDRSEDELVSELGTYRPAYVTAAVLGGIGAVLLTVGSGVV